MNIVRVTRYDYLDEDYYSDEIMEEEFVPEFLTKSTDYVVSCGIFSKYSFADFPEYLFAEFSLIFVCGIFPNTRLRKSFS